MSHQPPSPRNESGSTPITQNASIQPIRLGREFTRCVLSAAVCDADNPPGATMRGKSPETMALLTAEEAAAYEGEAGERISHPNVSTAAAGIASIDDRARM